MAYISKQAVKDKRKAIRAMFPTKDGWNWSVTAMDDHVGVTVALLKYPKGFKFPEGLVIDHQNPAATCDDHNIKGWEKRAIMAAGEILTDGWLDNESLTFYPSLRIGTWDQSATESAE